MKYKVQHVMTTPMQCIVAMKASALGPLRSASEELCEFVHCTLYVLFLRIALYWWNCLKQFLSDVRHRYTWQVEHLTRASFLHPARRHLW